MKLLGILEMLKNFELLSCKSNFLHIRQFVKTGTKCHIQHLHNPCLFPGRTLSEEHSGGGERGRILGGKVLAVPDFLVSLPTRLRGASPRLGNADQEGWFPRADDC